MTGSRPARAIAERRHAVQPRRQQVQRPRRPDLQFRQRPRALCSYATSYNPIIGLNASNQLFLPETGEQAEIGLKYQPAGFNGHFSIAVFDLKRQNVPTTVPGITTLQNQTGEITSRGLELEAVANLAPGLKMVGAFTTYDLFHQQGCRIRHLIGLTPTNTPQQTGSLWADYTFQEGPLTRLWLWRRRALCRKILCR